MSSWPERNIKACPSCGHTMSQGLCWRLTCPSHGAGISARLVRDRVERESAAGAKRLMRSSLFDQEPPDKALAFVQFDDEEEPDFG